MGLPLPCESWEADLTSTVDRVQDVHIPLLSILTSISQESLADAEFEPVVRLLTIGEIPL